MSNDINQEAENNFLKTLKDVYGYLNVVNKYEESVQIYNIYFALQS